jgi:hypothetical protein
MKKLFFIGAVVLGTYSFSACESKSGSDGEGTVVESDTVVETDTTVTETVVETDTVTRTTEGGEGTDTTSKQ